jgi:DNA (cytosine-5)-methyltransferase 1
LEQPPGQVFGAFSGVGGLEQGLAAAGCRTIRMVENDPHAITVLRARNRDVPIESDIRTVASIPRVDIVVAGFPCQDLSPSGRLEGIHGERSRLLTFVFTAIANSPTRPPWLLFENVPFLLNFRGGEAMAWLTRNLEELGYCWAYRVLDSQWFGVAQRRQRVFILASREGNPASILLAAPLPTLRRDKTFDGRPCGFYWTEGNRGLGWAVDAIPPLKVASGLGIPAPPAIWLAESGHFVMPTIDDAEALQGFERGWTEASAEMPGGNRARWRLVGNAVSVPVAAWIGGRLVEQKDERIEAGVYVTDSSWSSSGWGGRGRRYVARNELIGPPHVESRSIHEFLSVRAPTLSKRAAKGFLFRLERSRLRVPSAFLDDLRFHVFNEDHVGSDDQRANVPDWRTRQSFRARGQIKAA